MAFSSFSPWLCPSIEPDLPALCNREFISSQQTAETAARFRALDQALRNSKKGAKLNTVQAKQTKDWFQGVFMPNLVDDF